MNYIGSKLSLLNFLDESINKVVGVNYNTFCDLFAGTGIVGRHFKKKGVKIVSNDIQYYSYILNRHYIGNRKTLKFVRLFEKFPQLKKINSSDRKNFICDHLSNLKGIKGFIYKNYCITGTTNKEHTRQYFSDDNGMLCDAIRLKIEDWKKNKLINEDEYYFLIASLIESTDKCANTASVYGAFLKQLKKSAQAKLVLRPAELIISDQDNQVFNKDANEVINEISAEVLYLDPPYNQRQYATNYHLLETIAKYDNPQIFGKTGLRNYQDQKSNYCSKNQVKKAFKDLILGAKAKYIFLSYNNEGLMSLKEIEEIMSLKGKYGYFIKEYGRFKADRSENREFLSNKTFEYLHYVKCE